MVWSYFASFGRSSDLEAKDQALSLKFEQKNDVCTIIFNYFLKKEIACYKDQIEFYEEMKTLKKYSVTLENSICPSTRKFYATNGKNVFNHIAKKCNKLFLKLIFSKIDATEFAARLFSEESKAAIAFDELALGKMESWRVKIEGAKKTMALIVQELDKKLLKAPFVLQMQLPDEKALKILSFKANPDFASPKKLCFELNLTIDQEVALSYYGEISSKFENFYSLEDLIKTEGEMETQEKIEPLLVDVLLSIFIAHKNEEATFSIHPHFLSEALFLAAMQSGFEKVELFNKGDGTPICISYENAEKFTGQTTFGKEICRDLFK